LPGRAGAPVGPGGAERPAGDGAAPPALDLSVLEQLRQTMGGGSLGDLVSTFADDARELVATMRRALTEQDVASFRRAAHSLNSNAAGFGARTLSALARGLETLAKTGSLDGAAARLERLADEWERVARALEEVEP
jgi:HPt (histidine-containing phosphotransfer) domain-containing protein